MIGVPAGIGRPAAVTPIGPDDDPTESERRHQPELNRVTPIEKKTPIDNEFEIELPDDTQDEATRNQRLTRVMRGVARQVSLDPNDGMEL